MKRATLILLTSIVAVTASAAIRRDPNGVNVNSQGATTVFITFGGLASQVPVEAFWCGELIAATPDIGSKCRPDTIFGRLPIRYDRSRVQGAVFTDIMSIPQNVARRAYQAAQAGETSSFFYVRRFVSTAGGPDEYVFVTCRMAGVGARVPLAITDVKVQFEVESTLLPVRPGQTPPPLFADIRYNGTGRLKGRWEVVLPGDDPPRTEDLLTEASVPVDQRATQRRYTQLERFNVFVPPTGRARIPGPDPAKLPTATEGLYLVLLRVEASDDKESDSNLALAGAGNGIVHSGGVAGFPMPVLRYYVGSAADVIAPSGMAELSLLAPAEGEFIAAGLPLEFRWRGRSSGVFQRLEIRDATNTTVLSALLDPAVQKYTTPTWFGDKVTAGRMRWRIVVLSSEGEEIDSTRWRDLHVKPKS
jgi:hypothetical protein